MCIRDSPLIGIFGLSIFLGACIDRIDFERPQTLEDAIAIQGKLVKGSPSRVNVSIRKVLDFKSAPRFVKARSVTLLDDAGNAIDLDTNAEGIYYKIIHDEEPRISIRYDKSYKIKVETFEDLVFESALESIIPSPTPTKLTAHRIKKEGRNAIGDVILRDDFIGFVIDTPLEVSPNAGNVKLLWEIEATHQLTDFPAPRSCTATVIDEQSKICYVTTSPVANFIPLDGTRLSVNRISDTISDAVIRSPQFAEGYYLTVQQQAVTAEVFEYWSQVNVVNTRTGSMFEAPVGQVKTNIKNLTNPAEEVFGYFYATEEKVIRAYVPPELAENPKPACPDIIGERSQQSSNCCNCLTIDGATAEKPVWWQ